MSGDCIGPEGPAGAELDSILLRALLSDATLSVAVMDGQGHLTMMSPALQELLGRPFEPAAAEDIPGLFHLRDADASRQLEPEEVPLVRASRGHTVRNAMVSVVAPGRAPQFLRSDAVPLRDPTGKALGAIVLVTDVTTERRAQQEQRQLRERLITTVNHELRTPLTAVLGHAELLQDLETDLPAQARASIAAIDRAAHSLRDIVQTISGLADLEQAAHLELSRVDARTIAQRVAARSTPHAQRRGISLHLSAPETATVVVDPDRVENALHALVDNALAHAPDASEVNLEVEVTDHTLTFSVCDQGTGIDPHDQGRLRKPFERGSHPRQPVSSRGLGLAIADTTALVHGGNLELSKRPSGFRVRLALPRTPQSNTTDRHLPSGKNYTTSGDVTGPRGGAV